MKISVYSRIIIVFDGANDQVIGYTNQEVFDLLGKSGISVYTIGTLGDNSALLDGSQKSIKVVLQTDEGDATVTASVNIPFASGALPSEEPQEVSSEQPEFSREAEESSSGMQAFLNKSLKSYEESQQLVFRPENPCANITIYHAMPPFLNSHTRKNILDNLYRNFKDGVIC